LGEINKTWKKRFFIIWNAKSNFKIEYFESEGGSLKGTINAGGYYVLPFDEAETRTLGTNGLKLVPFIETRRTWYIRCDTTDVERDEWNQILDVACARVSKIDILTFIYMYIHAYLI
jgi:hypothetical protein